MPFTATFLKTLRHAGFCVVLYHLQHPDLRVTLRSFIKVRPDYSYLGPDLCYFVNADGFTSQRPDSAACRRPGLQVRHWGNISKERFARAHCTLAISSHRMSSVVHCFWLFIEVNISYIVRLRVYSSVPRVMSNRFSCKHFVLWKWCHFCVLLCTAAAATITTTNTYYYYYYRDGNCKVKG